MAAASFARDFINSETHLMISIGFPILIPGLGPDCRPSQSKGQWHL
jgi:hypothetical protein